MTQAELASKLAAGVQTLQLVLPPATQARLLEYVALLAKWNAAYNLTAVRDPEQMIARHLLDSLAIAPLLRGERVIDVGSGPGLPGIPLALASPDRHFVLLDSNGKKTRFMVQALATLALDNAEVVQARAEDYRPTNGFTTVVSRAFASLADFVEMTAHLAAPDGCWLAMKGAVPAAEIQGLPAAFRVKAVHPLRVPGLEAERCAVEILKA